MMTSIEEYFPAIRAVGLFGSNKELSWSVTSSNSSGLHGFNIGLQSDHFTSDFLCARIMPSNMQLPESDVIQSGPSTVIPRRLLNPTLFSHGINTKRPPDELITEARDRARTYRSKVRDITEDHRAAMARRRFEVVQY